MAGNNIYEVIINFKDSKVDSMYCNCPYYGNCKHLAATLYYLDEHPELLDVIDYSKLISSLSEDEPRKFLSLELQTNHDMANRLRLLKIRMPTGNTIKIN